MINQAGRDAEVLIPTSYDDLSLVDILPDMAERREVMRMLFSSAAAEGNLFFYLRDFLEFGGELFPVAGGAREIRDERILYKTHKFCPPAEFQRRMQEDFLHIFDQSFYRVDKSRSSIGFGLGLSIAQSIAMAHGGKIYARANVPQGTIFTVSLPVKPK